MFRDRRTPFLMGSSAYVPAMQYAHGMVGSQPTPFSLGTPVVSDDDVIATAIDADAVANTLESYDYTSDAKYGRNLIMTVSADPGNSHVIEVRGFDYLMQPMLERFTGAS